MIIKNIKITNFKKHKFLEVGFTAGSNLISGSNYAGKSTIIQAALVGLLGNSVAPGQTTELINDDAKVGPLIFRRINPTHGGELNVRDQQRAQ